MTAIGSPPPRTAQALIAQASTISQFTAKDLQALINNGHLFKGSQVQAWEYIKSNLRKGSREAGYITDKQISDIKRQFLQAALSSPKVSESTKEIYRAYIGNHDSLGLASAFPAPGYLRLADKENNSAPAITCTGDDPPIREQNYGLARPRIF